MLLLAFAFLFVVSSCSPNQQEADDQETEQVDSESSTGDEHPSEHPSSDEGQESDSTSNEHPSEHPDSDDEEEEESDS